VAAYYNEIDPFAAQWLRNLIAAWHIASGDVDERSIASVRADDLRGFRQCHFFAGIGVWSYALRLAGWPDDREVWTGSCPCQPFSAAGKAEAYADERHLWPHWLRLIRECRPAVVFGEQVDAAIRTGWLDDVCLSLEELDYAVGAVSFPACSVGAPHIRQRLYFVADNDAAGRGIKRRAELLDRERTAQRHDADRRGESLAVADPQHAERRALSGPEQDERDRKDARRPKAHGIAGTRREALAVADADGGNASAEGIQRGREHGQQQEDGSTPEFVGDAEREGSQGRIRSGDLELHRAAGSNGSTATSGFWGDAIWLPCIDGKARPTKPGLFPLAHRAAARVGRLRAYGNAIVSEQAKVFIEAYMQVIA
jgi:DNA (cytosine-5)-methyltransferase 1